MIYQELLAKLKTLYPTAYRTFKEPQSPPFITIVYRYDNDLMADNINYVGIEYFNVELYTKDWNPPVEKEVENLFKYLEIAYEKSQTFLDSEDLYQTVYEIKLIGG